MSLYIILQGACVHYQIYNVTLQNKDGVLYFFILLLSTFNQYCHMFMPFLFMDVYSSTSHIST
jgi:hypothetical protein